MVLLGYTKYVTLFNTVGSVWQIRQGDADKGCIDGFA